MFFSLFNFSTSSERGAAFTNNGIAYTDQKYNKQFQAKQLTSPS